MSKLFLRFFFLHMIPANITPYQFKTFYQLCTRFMSSFYKILFSLYLHGVMKQKQKKHEVFKYELPMTWTGSRLLIEKESRNCFGTNIEIRFKHCKYVMVSETRACSVK